jgi:GNAT superfamily N-acetyltransferase
MTDITCAPLTGDRLGDYLAFFDTRAFADNPRWAGCYCYFPVHDPRQVEWEKRTAAENRADVAASIRAGTTSGVLAYRNGEVVGWCHAGPWLMYPTLRDPPEPDGATLGVVFCFVVAPDARGQGVATALLAAACDGLRARGMKEVQAKPRRDAKGAAANYYGPLSMYLAAGFRIVRETAEGDVFVRKALA